MPLLSFSDFKKSAVKTKQCTKRQTMTSTGAAKKGKGNLQQLEQTMGGNSSDSSMASKVTRSSNQNNGNKIDQQEDNEEEGKAEHSSIYVPTYRCKKCIYSIDDIHIFWHHYADVHKKQIYVCRVQPCVKWFEFSQGLRGHVKNFHKKDLTCEHCGLVNLTPVQLNIHYDTHVNANFTCNGCQKDFTCKDDSNRHWKYSCTKNPDRVTRCKHCIQVGIDPEIPGAEPGMLNHLQSVHKQKGVYLCMFRHNLFKTNQQITAHSQKCTKTHPVVS